MRQYDFKLANKIIKTFNDLGILKTAVMGMHEDWFYYSEDVFANGEYTKVGLMNYEEGNELKIAGISQSQWATPVILIQTVNDMHKYFNCYSGEWTIDILERISIIANIDNGEIANRVQELRDELEIFNFVESEYNI